MTAIMLILRRWFQRGVKTLATLFILTSTSTAMVLFDPGHGGYDGGAPEGPYSGHPEKDVNLKVSLRLDTILTEHECEYGVHYRFTRLTDIYLSRIERAHLADSLNVSEFISIHHDSNADRDLNYTAAYFCDDLRLDSVWIEAAAAWEYVTRDIRDTLAVKLFRRVRDAFVDTTTGEVVEPMSCTEETPYGCMRNYDVLRYTSMLSALTEASFISNWREDSLFWHPDYDSVRFKQESQALFDGWMSFVEGSGTGQVRVAYADSTSGVLYVNNIFHMSPFEGTWRPYEQYVVSVPYTQILGNKSRGHTRTFHHWSFIPTGTDPDESEDHEILSYNPICTLTVPNDFDYHRYVAYYSGGPYSVECISQYDTVFVGGEESIRWTGSAGADSTSRYEIYIERSGNMDAQPIATSRPYYRHVQPGYMEFPWDVNAPGTDSARYILFSTDVSDNFTSDTSEYFVIYDCGTLEVDWEELSTNKPQIDTLFFDYLCNKDHELTLTVYRLNGAAWDSVDTPFEDSSFSAGENTVVWEIDQEHQGEYETYKVAGFCNSQCGGSGPWLVDSFSVEYEIFNNKPIVISSIGFVGGQQCVHYGGDSVKVRVVAYDVEDGNNLHFYWRISNGHFPGGSNGMSTNKSVVTYCPPPDDDCPGPEKRGLPFSEDTITVTISDNHNGETVKRKLVNLRCEFSENPCPSPPSCDCPHQGDPVWGGGINVLDVVYMIDYVFREGPPPHWDEYCPISEGEYNCDHVINVLDVVYVIDHVFRFGPSPCDGCAKRDLT